MGPDIYNFGMRCTSIPLGLFLIFILMSVILKFCIVFINDDKFTLPSYFKHIVPYKFLLEENCLSEYLPMFFMMWLGNIMVFVLAVMFWPVTIIISISYGILLIMRFFKRTTKKFKIVAKYMHKHKNKEDIEKVPLK